MLAQAEAIEEMKETEIDLSDPDSPDLSGKSGWVRGAFYRPRKQSITIRMDMDVIDWFKKRSERYQSAINQACREYMETHRAKAPRGAVVKYGRLTRASTLAGQSLPESIWLSRHPAISTGRKVS